MWSVAAAMQLQALEAQEAAQEALQQQQAQLDRSRPRSRRRCSWLLPQAFSPPGQLGGVELSVPAPMERAAHAAPPLRSQSREVPCPCQEPRMGIFPRVAKKHHQPLAAAARQINTSRSA